jgi:solute carrier family 35 protein
VYSEFAIFHFLLANQLFISVALIVFGAFIAGARDLSFDARGYAIVFVANITTAVYLATINRIGNAPSFLPPLFSIHLHNFLISTCLVLGKSSGLNSFGLMWCNGIMFITCTKLRFDVILHMP